MGRRGTATSDAQGLDGNALVKHRSSARWWRRHRWRPGAPGGGHPPRHVVGLQRHGHFMQHADHGRPAPPGRAPRQPVGLVRCGSRLASGSSISSTCACTASGAPAARAGARRPTARRAGAQRQSRPAWRARPAPRRLVGREGAASQGWCGRRPSMATSQADRSSVPLVLAPARPVGGRRRAGRPAAHGWPSSCLPWCGSSPPAPSAASTCRHHWARRRWSSVTSQQASEMPCSMLGIFQA